MEITYAGKILGSDDELKHVSGFVPDFAAEMTAHTAVSSRRGFAVFKQNRTRPTKFRVTRDLGSVDAAFVFKIEHPETLAGSGVLILTQGGDSFRGSAVLRACRVVEADGVRATFEYEFFVPQFTRTDAPAADTVSDSLTEATSVIYASAPGIVPEGEVLTIIDQL